MDYDKIRKIEKTLNVIALALASISAIATVAGCLNYAVITEQKFYIFTALVTAVINAVLLIAAGNKIFRD